MSLSSSESPSPLHILQSYGRSSSLSSSNLYLSEDGKTLFFLGGGTTGLAESTADATVTYDTSTLLPDPSSAYSLASLYLQCVHPRDFRAYRKSCEKASCAPVKITDKKEVLMTLLGEAAFGKSQEVQDATPAAAAAAAAPTEDDKKKHKKELERDHHRHHSSKHREHHQHKKEKVHKEVSKSTSSSGNKREKTVFSNEQVLENLTLVADKQFEKRQQTATGQEIQTASTNTAADEDAAAPVTPTPGETLAGSSAELSSASDQIKFATESDIQREMRKQLQLLLSERIIVTDEELLSDLAATAGITAMEIPVGDSSSVLRAPGRDLSRVLEMYTEVKKREDREAAQAVLASKRKQGAKATGNAEKKTKKGPTGKPIIVVPNAMTSPITLVNATEFFSQAKFIPRDVLLKQRGAQGRVTGIITFSRKVTAKLGGKAIEYEVIDNPLKLPSRADWDRIVAVVAQGASWQFKGWPGSWGNPVEIFSRALGFYIGMEGVPVPKESQGWNVKRMIISRDKRGLDGMTHAKFWNA